MWVALCSGCGQFFPIGPKAEAEIAEGTLDNGEGTTKGYCAKRLLCHGTATGSYGASTRYYRVGSGVATVTPQFYHKAFLTALLNLCYNIGVHKISPQEMPWQARKSTR